MAVNCLSRIIKVLKYTKLHFGEELSTAVICLSIEKRSLGYVFIVLSAFGVTLPLHMHHCMVSCTALVLYSQLIHIQSRIMIIQDPFLRLTFALVFLSFPFLYIDHYSYKIFSILQYFSIVCHQLIYANWNISFFMYLILCLSGTESIKSVCLFFPVHPL